MPIDAHRCSTIWICSLKIDLRHLESKVECGRGCNMDSAIALNDDRGRPSVQDSCAEWCRPVPESLMHASLALGHEVWNCSLYHVSIAYSPTVIAHTHLVVLCSSLCASLFACKRNIPKHGDPQSLDLFLSVGRQSSQQNIAREWEFLNFCDIVASVGLLLCRCIMINFSMSLQRPRLMTSKEDMALLDHSNTGPLLCAMQSLWKSYTCKLVSNIWEPKGENWQREYCIALSVLNEDLWTRMLKTQVQRSDIKIHCRYDEMQLGLLSFWLVLALELLCICF